MFAEIEGVFAEVLRARITVGHHHFRHGSAVENGAQLALILITNRVEYHPLPRRKPDPKLPFLPAHPVSLNLKAGAFRLGNVQGFNVIAKARDKGFRIFAWLRRHRNIAPILNL